VRVVSGHGARRYYWLGALAVAAVPLWLGWQQLASQPAVSGRLMASGEVQLSDGSIQSISHSLQIDGARFYSLTRQGDSLVQTSGSVERSLLGSYRLRVEDGQVFNLNGQAQSDDALLFNLLYAQHPGSQISLTAVNGCLYSAQTQQLFCPQG
jgi:hypothetical protein